MNWRIGEGSLKKRRIRETAKEAIIKSRSW
jgi:hypothetical protein